MPRRKRGRKRITKKDIDLSVQESEEDASSQLEDKLSAKDPKCRSIVLSKSGTRTISESFGTKTEEPLANHDVRRSSRISKKFKSETLILEDSQDKQREKNVTDRTNRDKVEEGSKSCFDLTGQMYQGENNKFPSSKEFQTQNMLKNEIEEGKSSKYSPNMKKRNKIDRCNTAKFEVGCKGSNLQDLAHKKCQVESIEPQSLSESQSSHDFQEVKNQADKSKLSKEGKKINGDNRKDVEMEPKNPVPEDLASQTYQTCTSKENKLLEDLNIETEEEVDKGHKEKVEVKPIDLDHEDLASHTNQSEDTKLAFLPELGSQCTVNFLGLKNKMEEGKSSKDSQNLENKNIHKSNRGKVTECISPDPEDLANQACQAKGNEHPSLVIEKLCTLHSQNQKNETKEKEDALILDYSFSKQSFEEQSTDTLLSKRMESGNVETVSSDLDNLYSNFRNQSVHQDSVVNIVFEKISNNSSDPKQTLNYAGEVSGVPEVQANKEMAFDSIYKEKLNRDALQNEEIEFKRSDGLMDFAKNTFTLGESEKKKTFTKSQIVDTLIDDTDDCSIKCSTSNVGANVPDDENIFHSNYSEKIYNITTDQASRDGATIKNLNLKTVTEVKVEDRESCISDEIPIDVCNDGYNDAIIDVGEDDKYVIDDADKKMTKDVLNSVNDNSLIDDVPKKVTMLLSSSDNKINVTEAKNEAVSNLSKEGISKVDKTSSYTNQDWGKGKPNRIPGRSFIIGIKSPPSKGKKTMFDCVLCFENKAEPVPGSTINMHIKSREHALKVMELENLNMYECYKKDEITPVDVLITALLKFEEAHVKQSLILANPENYGEKREAVLKRISLLRQLNAKKTVLGDSAVIFTSTQISSFAPITTTLKASTKSSSETSTSSTVLPFTAYIPSLFNELSEKKSEATAITTTVTSEVKKEIDFDSKKKTMEQHFATSLELANKQKKRTTSRVLIVTDYRDASLDPHIFEKNVRLLRRKDLNFDNAFHYIKDDDWFGSGTLYIILCGIFSIVKLRPHFFCLKHSCFSPLEVFYLEKDLTPDYLVDKALKLHSLILDSTVKDKVLFCDLIPINIDSGNVAKLEKRPCYNIHPIDVHRKVPLYLTKMYLEIVTTYNNFVKVHSDNLGLKFMDMLRYTFSVNMDDPHLALNRLGNDGVSFIKEDCQQRQSHILKIVRDLITTVECKDGSAPKTECIAGDIVKMSHMDIDVDNDSPSSSKKDDVDSLHLPVSFDRFDMIVILANSIYEQVLQQFAGPQVIIYEDENLRFDTVGNFIAEKSDKLPPKTLWLTLIGSFCIFEVNKHSGCLLEKCSKPLSTLTPSHDVLGLASALDTINKIRKSCIVLTNEIRSGLKQESAFLMLPPFPPTVHVEENFLHSTLHSLQGLNPDIYITAEKITDHIDTVFTNFNKEMISLIIEELGRMNFPQKPILDYKTNLSDGHMHIVRHLKESNTIPLTKWEKAISALISDLLNVNKDITAAKPKSTRLDSNRNTKNISQSVLVSAVNVTTNNSPPIESQACPPSVNITSKSKWSSPKHFDHLAFIGCQEQLHQLGTTGKSNISIWSLKFPLDWADMKTKFVSLESISKKKKLFVILVDISLIGVEVFDSYCKIQDCKTKISYLTTGTSSVSALIEDKIDSINRLASRINCHFPDSSKVILAPICTRLCIEKPITNDHKLHSTLHDSMKHECHPCILEGPKKIWEDAVLLFSVMWEKEVHSYLDINDENILKLMKKYKKKPVSLLEWRNPNKIHMTSNTSYTSHCKLFLKELMDTVLPLPKKPQSQTDTKTKQQQPELQKAISLTKEKMASHQLPNKQTIPPFKQFVEQPFMPIQHPPMMRMPYGPYPMDMQQQNVYMNSPYNSGTYGMDFNYQQHQHQPYIDPNFSSQNVPYLQQEIYQQQGVNPYSHDASYNTYQPTYSSQTTYQGSAVTYTQPQEISLHIPSQVTSQIQVPPPKPSLVPIPLTEPAKPNKCSTTQNKSISVREASSAAEATQAFTETLQALLTSNEFSVGSTFEQAFIIGKKDLIHPLSEMNLKNTKLIYHNLSSITEKDVPLLLSKIGTMEKNCVCFLAFSLSVVTKTIPLSPSCTKFSCKQPIPLSNLKFDLHDPDPKPNSTIVKRIKELVDFVAKLSKFISTIVLPLFPTRMFCDDASAISKHRISHAITNCDSYVVMGTKESWETYMATFVQLWNNFIKANHKKYISSDLIAKYVLVQKNTIAIKEHVNDFFTEFSEPTLWRAFLQTIMQVLMTNLKTLPPFSSVQKKKLLTVQVARNIPGLNSEKLKSKNSSSPKDSPVPVSGSISTVKIWNLSQSIPADFFHSLFQTIEPISSMKALHDTYEVKLTPGNASMIVDKLNDYQIGDTTLRACEIGAKNKKKMSLNVVQRNYIKSIFDQIYLRWKPCIIERLQERLEREFEIPNYKTVRCTKSCSESDINKCVFYHSEMDKRRNPKIHSYNQKMCPFPKVSQVGCAYGDACIFSHNIYEQMFYPTNFQTIVCPTLNVLKCKKKPFCKFAHENTPEMFFIGAWKDLVTFETRNTFDFLAGAVRGISKLSYKKDVKVCLISPSEELLDVAQNAIANILKTHKLRLVLLPKKWINSDLYDVFLGTPPIIANYHGHLLSLKTVGALIVDDINTILQNSLHKENLLKIFQKMKIISNQQSLINKVFVASHYDSEIAAKIKTLFGLPHLTEVKDQVVAATEPTVDLKQGDSKQNINSVNDKRKRKAASSRSSSSDSPCDSGKSSSRYQKWIRRRKSRSRSHSRHRSHSRSLSRRSRSPSHSRHRKSAPRFRRSRSDDEQKTSMSSDSRRRSSRSNSKNRSLKRIQSPQSDTIHAAKKPKTQDQRPHIPAEQSHTATPFFNPLETKADQSPHPKLENPVCSTYSSIHSRRNAFGEDLFSEFVKAERIARKTHEDEFEVFKTFPELYSDYELYYEEFATQYFKRFGTNKGEKHKEHFWNEYWKAKFLLVKEKDWQKKKNDLENDYKVKEKLANPRREEPEAQVAGSSQGKFSIEGTFNLLDKLSINLGMLGPAILAIVKSAKDLGTTTTQALAVFTNEENVVLINMVIEKLKVFQKSAPDYLVSTVTQAIEWTKELLEFAKNPPKAKEISLNLEAIAKASLGKDSAFILNLIKTALAYEGIPSLSKEEINNLFMKVCSMHFDMAMKG